MNANYLKTLWKSSLMILMLCFGLTSLWGQVTLLSWNSTGQSNFGTSPWVTTAPDGIILTQGITRGSNISTSGSAAGNAWGGSGNWATGTADNGSVTLTITVDEGYVLSLNSITAKTRRSNSGPDTNKVYYSLNGESYTEIGEWSNTSTSGNNGASQSTDVSSVSNLQNIISGTVVRIRIAGFSTDSGNWYLNGGEGAFVLNGTIELDNNSQVATPTITAIGTANGIDTYWDSAEITIETTTPDATIYYTVNNGDLEEYSTPFEITSTSTIEAYAEADGLEDSEVATKTITITHTVPTITASTESITGLGYEFGSPTSTAQSFNLTGANLDGTESVMLFLDEDTNSDFEMSLDDITYSTDLTIENFGNGSTPVYVRLKSGLAISADYLDMITILNDYNSDELNILVEGAVTPPAPTTTVSETALSGFTYVLDNGPSSEQSFTVEGSYLTSDITVTAPTNYQVSLSSGSGFQNSVTLTQTDGTVAETTVYVQLNAGLGVNNYNGDITVTATDVANKTIALTGSVTCGASALPYSEDFESVTTPNVPNCTTVVQGGSGNLWTTSSPNESGFTSKALTYQWNTTNDADTWFFTNGLELEGGQSYRLSFRYGNNSTSYSESLRVAYGTSNSIAAMTTELADYPNINDNTPHSVTINFEPATTGTYYIGFQAYSEADNYRLYVDDILVEENVPTISVEPVTVPAFTAVTDGSDSEDIIITGILLSDNIDIALSGTNADQFSLSATSLDSAGGTLTVTYEPTTVGDHNATLTLSSTDATDVMLTLNGTATLGVPVATAATAIGSDSFTANWEAVAGAESYEIDVWTIEETESSELVLNGGFESGDTSNWSFDSGMNQTANISQVHSGVYSLYTTVSATRNMSQVITVESEEEYTLGFWYYIDNTSTGNGFRLWTTAGATITPSTYLNTKGSWQYAEYNFTTTANSLTLNFRLYSGIKLYIDDISVKLAGESSTVVYTLQNEDVGDVTSYNVTDLDPETTYYYVVRAIAGAETSVNSNEIEVETLAVPAAVVWTTDNAWLNDIEPTITDDVIIEGDNYVVVGNVAAKTLTVANGGKITVPMDAVLTVDGKITNNGDFTVENDGILIQTEDYTGANEGAITVLRDANPMKRLDYTLWSSPVSGMFLNQFSNISPNGGTGTIWNRVYELGATAWNSIWSSYENAEESTATFTASKGYLYRAPNGFTTTAQEFTGEFTGVPHNGNYSINTPNAFDAIGNPYPSPVDAESFLAQNPGILYFWTNVNAPEDGSYDEINNWAYYVANVGGVGVADIENGGIKFQPQLGMLIQPGQGFVFGTEETTVTFNNSMRRTTNGSFFKQMSNEKHRFWLNLSNEEVVFNQILVGYIEDATQGVDTGIDAKMFAYEGNALYSTIENSEENYVIQGRALPFEASDVVALGFRAVNAGSFTISLHNFDGLFAANQNIYLKDNYTQALHNLKDGAYNFVSEEGIFDTRFEVVYQTTMSVENPVANNSNWVVYSQENGFQVQTQGFELQNVQVFDLLGRAVYTAQAQGTAHNIPALGADSVYIVKVTTTDNVVLSKKVR